MTGSRDPKGMLGMLIGSYGDLTRRLARKLGAVSDAQEVLQETWIKLASVPEGHEISNPQSYVVSVADNLAIDRLRAQRVRKRHFTGSEAPDLPDDIPSVERVLDYRQRLARLEAIVAALPPRQREVFLMHKFDGLSLLISTEK